MSNTLRALFVTTASLLVSAACSARTAPAPKYATAPADEFSTDEVPESCASLIDRVNARGPERLAAWVELSRCVAKSAIAQVDVDNSADSVAVLEELTGPSFVLLDHVLGRADVPLKIAALRAKADIYGEMGEPFHAHALATHRRIVALGEAHPELASDPQVKLAIRHSERQLNAPIATRD